MKLITLTAIAALTTLPLLAQDFTVTESGSTETYDQKQSEEIQFTVGGIHYFVTANFQAAQMHYYMQTVSAEGAGLQAGKLEVPVGVFNDSYSISEVLGLGNQAYVLVEHMDKGNQKMTFTARKLNSNSAIDAEGVDVMEYAFEKAMRSGYLYAATSNDHKLMAVVGVMPYDKNLPTRIQVAVYDENLKKISDGSFEMEGDDMKNKRIEMSVANDGTVYITRFTNTVKEGYGLLVHQYNSKTKTVENTYQIKTEDGYQMIDYKYAVNPKNELVIAGTFYKRVTISTGLDPKADHIFLFRTKDKTEGVYEKSTIDTQAENLEISSILFSGETTFVTAEQLKEDRLDNPSNPASTDYSYRYTHGNEYIFGFNPEGKKSFELVLEQSFNTTNLHRQFRSAHHIIDGNLVFIYNDQFAKYRADGDEAGSNIIPVAVVVEPSGLMKPAIPFINGLKLPSGYVLNPAFSLNQGNTIMTFMQNGTTTKAAKISVN